MGKGRIFPATALIVASIFGPMFTIAAGTTGVLAQDSQVVVVVGEKNRDACEVQSRKKVESPTDSYWRDLGDPVACQGGLVIAYVTTEEEAASQQVTASSTGEEVRIVPLTGDAEADEAAVQTKIDDIHFTFDPNADNELDSPVGTEGSTCHTGDPIGTRRSENYRVRVKTADTRIVGGVYYRRISCAKWEIYAVTLVPLREPTIRVYFRDFFYRSAVDNKQAGAQCWRLRADDPETFRPYWNIQARGKAKVELVDAHPNAGGVWPCALGVGTSFDSLWFTLHGGIS